LKEENKLVAEVGPIKYIGDMVYGTDDANAIDKAVRLVIMLIMVVFDPLAVLLLIAANMSMSRSSVGKPIVKDGEIVGVTAQDIPVFVPEKEKPKETDKVEIDKQNIVQIEENIPEQEPIIIDEASGESIPPISKSKRGFPNRKSKIDSMYVDDAELAFRKMRLFYSTIVSLVLLKVILTALASILIVSCIHHLPILSSLSSTLCSNLHSWSVATD